MKTWLPYVFNFGDWLLLAARVRCIGGIVRNDRLDGPKLKLSPLWTAAQGYERRN